MKLNLSVVALALASSALTFAAPLPPPGAGEDIARGIAEAAETSGHATNPLAPAYYPGHAPPQAPGSQGAHYGGGGGYVPPPSYGQAYFNGERYISMPSPRPYVPGGPGGGRHFIEPPPPYHGGAGYASPPSYGSGAYSAPPPPHPGYGGGYAPAPPSPYSYFDGHETHPAPVPYHSSYRYATHPDYREDSARFEESNPASILASPPRHGH